MLLDKLQSSGYTFRNMEQIATNSGEFAVFLRHDIDLHILGLEDMAKIEAKRGIHATYYVPLTLHFNPLYPDNQETLRKVQDLGHEIGLHYDMITYPTGPTAAMAHLDWEASILTKIVGRRIRTICMHQPHQGHADPFKDIDEFCHPHNPRYQEGTLYVSDSCRTWRDKSLLTCFADSRPKRLQLTIHPELWLDGTITDGLDYLERVLMKRGLRQHHDYFDQKVRQVWLTHPSRNQLD